MQVKLEGWQRGAQQERNSPQSPPVNVIVAEGYDSYFFVGITNDRRDPIQTPISDLDKVC